MKKSKMMNLMDFPTPKWTTDIENWFKQINQVPSYPQLIEQAQDSVFEESSPFNACAIREGMEICGLNEPIKFHPD